MWGLKKAIPDEQKYEMSAQFSVRYTKKRDVDTKVTRQELTVGLVVGLLDGRGVIGASLGLFDGDEDGSAVGLSDGDGVKGLLLGDTVGSDVVGLGVAGASVGSAVGCDVIGFLVGGGLAGVGRGVRLGRTGGVVGGGFT